MWADKHNKKTTSKKIYVVDVIKLWVFPQFYMTVNCEEEQMH